MSAHNKVRIPFILPPADGELLMVAVTCASRSRAESQAEAWNTVLGSDGHVVTVGARDDDGQWPLVWTAVNR